MLWKVPFLCFLTIKSLGQADCFPFHTVTQQVTVVQHVTLSHDKSKLVKIQNCYNQSHIKTKTTFLTCIHKKKKKILTKRQTANVLLMLVCICLNVSSLS